jgi:hypothetical protein
MLSLGFMYLFAYVNTNAGSFLCFCPKINVKVFCGTTNTTSLLDKWTRSAAPPVTRDLLSFYGTLLKRGKRFAELAPEMPSRTHPYCPKLAISRSVKCFS